MAHFPIPEGFHTITPWLIIRGAKKALDFYQRAFNAETLFIMPGMATDEIGHAQLRIGSSMLMLSDPCPIEPSPVDGSPTALYLYVEDVDALFAQALAAGAKEIIPLTLQFYGDKSGCVEDPFGNRWFLASRVEVVSPEELNRRAATLMSQEQA